MRNVPSARAIAPATSVLSAFDQTATDADATAAWLAVSITGPRISPGPDPGGCDGPGRGGACASRETLPAPRDIKTASSTLFMVSRTGKRGRAGLPLR